MKPGFAILASLLFAFSISAGVQAQDDTDSAQSKAAADTASSDDVMEKFTAMERRLEEVAGENAALRNEMEELKE